MKKKISKSALGLFSVALLSIFLWSCGEKLDLRYNGSTVVEFKNRYLELQSRLGSGNFGLLYPNITENINLSSIAARQPSVTRTGTITTNANPGTQRNVAGTGTTFTTQLAVGSIIRDAAGNFIGVVATITSNTALTLVADARVIVTGSNYRASNGPGIAQLTFADSVLVQLVGPQRTSDLNVTFVQDAAPAGATQAVEGVHFDFVRNPSGQIVFKANSSSAYIYLNVYNGISGADPERVVLNLTLQSGNGIQPSENYKTFTYNILK
jgi:hypothetical protein